MGQCHLRPSLPDFHESSAELLQDTSPTGGSLLDSVNHCHYQVVFVLSLATFQLTDVKDQVPEEFVSKLMGGSRGLSPWVAGKASGMPRALRTSLLVCPWGKGAELSRMC